MKVIINFVINENGKPVPDAAIPEYLLPLEPAICTHDHGRRTLFWVGDRGEMFRLAEAGILRVYPEATDLDLDVELPVTGDSIHVTAAYQAVIASTQYKMFGSFEPVLDNKAF